MHICLVTSGRPSEVFYGGEEKFTVSFRNWLLSQGHEVTIVARKLFGVQVIDSHKIPRDIPRTQTVRPKVLHLPYPIYALALLISAFLMVFRILAINNRSRISIVHAQDTGYGGLSAIISSRVLGIPAIITSHGLRHATLGRNLKGLSAPLLKFEYWLDATTSRRADFLIAVNSSTETFFARIGVRRIETIPVGIEISEFDTNGTVRQKMRRQFEIEDYVVIGFLGRFSPEKNLQTLLEAFRQVVRRVDRVKLMLVGTGVLEDQLRRFCRIQKMEDKVIFTGVRADVSRLLSALDIFVLPSYTEGSPTALIEAMASGKAIVASDILAIREMVEDGRDVVLVDPKRPELLERQLVRLCRDPQLRKKLGENAKSKARQYDVNEVFPRMLSVYESVSRERSKMR